MKNIVHPQTKLVFFCVPFLVFGCASDPVSTPKPEPIISGDTMIQESQGIASLGDRWKAGKEMVDRGTAMVSEGETKIEEGHRMIAEGNKIISESEESYKSRKK